MPVDIDYIIKRNLKAAFDHLKTTNIYMNRKCNNFDIRKMDMIADKLKEKYQMYLNKENNNG